MAAKKTAKVEETVLETVETVEVKEEKKAPAKKAATKKAVKTTLIIQSGEKEVTEEEAVKRVKAAWKATGNKVGDLKTITLYVKPEEDSIYYVINGDVTGRVEF